MKWQNSKDKYIMSKELLQQVITVCIFFFRATLLFCSTRESLFAVRMDTVVQGTQWITVGSGRISLNPTGLQEGRIKLFSVFSIERILLVVSAPEGRQRRMIIGKINADKTAVTDLQTKALSKYVSMVHICK